MIASLDKIRPQAGETKNKLFSSSVLSRLFFLLPSQQIDKEEES
jgi:hypothetical protein